MEPKNKSNEEIIVNQVKKHRPGFLEELDSGLNCLIDAFVYVIENEMLEILAMTAFFSLIVFGIPWLLHIPNPLLITTQHLMKALSAVK